MQGTTSDEVPKTLRVLILEDSEDAAVFLVCEIQQAGYNVVHERVKTAKEMEAALENFSWDLIIADYTMPGFSGLEGLRLVKERGIDVPFIVVSASITEETAVRMMKAGAHDYVMKTNLRRLVPALERELHEAEERRQHRRIENRNAALSRLAQKLGSVVEVEQAARQIAGVADDLFGWDACSIDLYCQEEDCIRSLIHLDVVEGRRTDVRPAYSDEEPSPLARRIIEGGGEIIRRAAPAQFDAETRPFGDTSRPSASIMSVPIRNAARVVGVLSIHSYTPQAYGEEDLAVLQSLADHCGSVLERIRAAEALSESEERFRTLSESIPIGIFQTNGEGLCFYTNARWRAISGLTAEQSSGYGWTGAIHPEDRPSILRNWRRALTEDRDWSEEYRLQTPEDQIRWVRSLATPVVSQGQRTGFVVTIEDITERKRIERRNAVLSRLSHHLSSAASAQEAARFIGSAAEDLFGWDAFTLFLYSVQDDTVVPVLSIDTINGQKVATTGTSQRSVKARHVMQSGPELILREEPASSPVDTEPFGDVTRRSASLMYVPIQERTHAVGVISVQSYKLNAYTQADLETLQVVADHCRGALERLRAEAALQTSEMLFHSVWENSVDGMRLTDENGVIVAVNDAFCKLVGMSREDLEGKPFTVTYAESEALDDILQQFKDRFRSGKIDKRLRRKLTFRSGKTVDLEDTNSLVELKGRRMLLALFRDITEQRRLEEELRHSQKMESIGQLAGGIAHDFNNLLTVIQCHASMLASTENLPAELTDSVRQISVAAERSSHLTRQLLTFGRRQVTQPRNLDLNEIVSSMTTMLCRILGEDIKLRVQCAPSLPLIHADQGMMEQVIMNLAINARDAMSKGGELVISTISMEVDAAYCGRNPEASPGTAVCLSVADTGCGIAPEVLPRIFEPFFTTKDVGKGTGLGLATVYGIVKQHQGWIKVESDVDKETVFQIFLPGKQAGGRNSDEKADDTGIFGGTETILVVEDEALLRELVQYILELHGYRVLHAHSGVAALEIWNQSRHEIDLLLTDMIMPEGVTGRELAEKLLAEDPDLKVIFTSGYSAEILGKDLVLSEGITFLQKPYPPRKLVQTVRHCLDGGTGEKSSGASASGSGKP